jgi:glycerophosphoryl diester phosphodiesterase
METSTITGIVPRLLPLLLCGMALLASASAGATPLERQLEELQGVQVIAHRGASGHAPEHTLPAFRLARDMQADYLELDIQMTADGELVVFHDETLERTTDGTGPLRNFTLEELKALDTGNWFNEAHPAHADAAYVGLEIPTLGEVIEEFGSETRYYLETKSPQRYPGIEAALLEELEANGLIAVGSVVIQSFRRDSLLKVRELDARIPLVQLVYYSPEEEDSQRLVEWNAVTPGPGEISDEDFRTIRDYAVGLGTNLSYWDRLEVIDAAFIEQARANDLLVHVYTINEPTEMRRLIDWGVDGIFTDYPDRMKALLEKAGP